MTLNVFFSKFTIKISLQIQFCTREGKYRLKNASCGTIKINSKHTKDLLLYSFIKFNQKLSFVSFSKKYFIFSHEQKHSSCVLKNFKTFVASMMGERKRQLSLLKEEGVVTVLRTGDSRLCSIYREFH